MRFGRTVLVVVGVAGGLTGVVGLRAGRVEAKDRTVMLAGQKSASDSGVATLQVYSRETLVDVTVTDAKGQPVHGLTQADFTVEEDGKVQPVRSFQEFGAGVPVAERELPKLPADVYTNVQAAPPSGSVNIFLLDFLNVPPKGQAFMRDATLDYLKKMPRGTQVAVFGMSKDHGLQLVQGFTTDGAAAAASVLGFPRQVTTYLPATRNPMTLDYIGQIAAYLSGIKGRKNLIWFPFDMTLNVVPPYIPGPGKVVQKSDAYMEATTNYSVELNKAFDQLRAAQVAVYPISIRGLDPGPAGPPALVLAFNMQIAGEASFQEALAAATGGVAYGNTNGFETAVEKAIENGSNYYGLSYVPSNREQDGKYHTIKVRVDQPGVHLAYRPGYTEDDFSHARKAPGDHGTESVHAANNISTAMTRGVPVSSQLLFSVKMDPVANMTKPVAGQVLGSLDPKLAGKILRRYELHFSLPGRQIAVTELEDGRHEASLEFEIMAYDSDGKVVTSLSQTIHLPLTAERYRQLQTSPFQVVQQIDLPPGALFVRVGILDAVSNKVGTMEIPVMVAKGPVVAAGR